MSLFSKLGGIGVKHMGPSDVSTRKLGKDDVKRLEAHGVKLTDDSFKGNAPAMAKLDHLLEALKKGGNLSMADTQELHALKAAHDGPHPMIQDMK